MDPKKTRIVNVRIDAAADEALTTLAEENSVTVSDLIRDGIDRVIHDSEESDLQSDD